MNERDDSIRIDDVISSDVSQRVRSVISAAESAATAIRHEAEEQAQAARRQAEQERQRYLDEARREADRLLTERIEKISALSDELIEGAEQVLTRLGGAQEVKRQLETLVRSLADTAERLSREREEVRGAVSGFETRTCRPRRPSPSRWWQPRRSRPGRPRWRPSSRRTRSRSRST
jgi:chromosome segregation ATPase